MLRFRCLLLSLLLIGATSFAQSKELNIYTWTGYMPDSVIQKFENETGIKVNLMEFDSNETLYTKIKANPNAGYDIIVPSAYYVDKMQKQGMLHELDKSKLPNFKNLSPLLLNKPFDPGNKYSVPYCWGSTGIVVNRKYIDPKTVTKWQDLWDPKYHNQLMMLDDIREVFGMAMQTLGYSINDRNPDHIKQAYLKLRLLMPNIKIFNSDAEQNIYIDEDALIGMGWSGDIGMAQEENKDLVYIYPKEGFSIWVDCLAIAKNAPHLEAAHKFIDFVMRPDISAEISITNHYPSPNLQAFKLLPSNLRRNPMINPASDVLEKGEFELDLGDAIGTYTKYWELLKIS
jgi:spermidine/putrescine transport system substrate-binding protein